MEKQEEIKLKFFYGCCCPMKPLKYIKSFIVFSIVLSALECVVALIGLLTTFYYEEIIPGYLTGFALSLAVLVYSSITIR